MLFTINKSVLWQCVEGKLLKTENDSLRTLPSQKFYLVIVRYQLHSGILLRHYYPLIASACSWSPCDIMNMVASCFRCWGYFHWILFPVTSTNYWWYPCENLCLDGVLCTDYDNYYVHTNLFMYVCMHVSGTVGGGSVYDECRTKKVLSVC